MDSDAAPYDRRLPVMITLCGHQRSAFLGNFNADVFLRRVVTPLSNNSPLIHRSPEGGVARR